MSFPRIKVISQNGYLTELMSIVPFYEREFKVKTKELNNRNDFKCQNHLL
ncbi:hypothetical protein Gromo_00126 [Candidatus Gromoviella agglomerans]|nr:hypothetical protein Gromo_00126 [Candidatus Gromoviella agglomerans]